MTGNTISNCLDVVAPYRNITKDELLTGLLNHNGVFIAALSFA